MSKRVRFSSSEPQVHVLPDTIKTSSREEDEQVEQLAGDYKRLKTGSDMHSEIAAEAAHISRENRRRRAGRGGQSESDLLDDIEQAEEDAHSLAEDDNEEIPLEPFNLKREREEGTFSADGYWEEKKQEKKQPVGRFNEKGEYEIVRDEDEDEEADAWVDGLKDVKVDEALAAKLRKEQAAQAKAGYDDDMLDDEDKAVYKRRVASMLDAGETVLSALRRLGGGGRQERGRDNRRGRRQRGKGAAAGGSSGTDAGAAGGGVSTENKAAFNKLTELADALLSNGEYNIYSMTREDLGGGPPGDASSSGLASAGSAEGSKESVGSIFANAVLAPAPAPQQAAAAADEEMDDMFGDDDGPPAAAAGGEQAGTAGSAAAAPAAASGEDRAAGAAAAVSGQAPTAGAGDAPPAEGSGAMEGFQYDEGSGYYYNSQLGYWYDASTGLYGDASTGLWYSYADGQYTLVDTAAAAASQTASAAAG